MPVALDPSGHYDFDHLYSGAGAAPGHGAGATADTQHGLAAPVVGLVDTGVASDHPAFAGTTIRQQGFAPGGVGQLS